MIVHALDALRLHLGRVSAGSSMAARIAMIAMTTSSSIKVNPARMILLLSYFQISFANFVQTPMKKGNRHRRDGFPSPITVQSRQSCWKASTRRRHSPAGEVVSVYCVVVSTGEMVV